jgi:hypothetical protein
VTKNICSAQNVVTMAPVIVNFSVTNDIQCDFNTVLMYST